MTVRELIAELQKLDPDAVVGIATEHQSGKAWTVVVSPMGNGVTILG